ncbi:MAG: sigma 54-interacting transcriptional regulator [Candidatus Hydrogenedentes bacterium]|nr:sigma 54-interacting transcriptional regulator [Candidatus Hydrogenedentota bacterium]
MSASDLKKADRPMPMTTGHCVRMICGPLVGKTWVLSDGENLLGRSIGCHIRLDDPHVSRVQCELHQHPEGLLLRSVGKRNPTCVNGIPVEETLLAPGDIVSFATSSLILDRASSVSTTSGPRDGRTTQSIDEVVHIRQDFDHGAYAQDASLTADLHLLVTLLRSLGRADTLESVVTLLMNHLRERLKASHLWVGWRFHSQDEIVLYPPATPEETRAAPFSIMEEACAEATGVMRPGSAPSLDHCFAAAPLLHGGDPFGAIAVRRLATQGAFTENDLHYLVAVAECSAPLIRAAERLEQMQRDSQHQTPLAAGANLASATSQATLTLNREIRRAAVARVNVVVQGETGVGKELAARMLHDLSARHQGPYVVVNSASLSPEMFESEMFGHERGAFTGATHRRKGLFELAHGGTLFLDEITELSLANQAHLLRVVETGIFRPVGSEKELRVDVRIVCATNRPLPDKSQTYFRTDLYHRLAGIIIRIKPLRERKGEIATLATHFLSLNAPHTQMHPKGFTQEAMDKLMAYDWPGNIRELRNVVERACFMTQSEYLSSSDLCIEDNAPLPAPETAPGIVSLDDLERQHLLAMLRRHGNSVVKVATALGLSRSALYYKLARHDIKPRQAAD